MHTLTLACPLLYKCNWYYMYVQVLFYFTITNCLICVIICMHHVGWVFLALLVKCNWGNSCEWIDLFECSPLACFTIVCLFMYTASVIFWLLLQGQRTVLYWGDWVPVYTSFGGSWGLKRAWGWLSPEHGTSIYSMIRTACQPDQILASIMLDFSCGSLQWRLLELVKSSYTIAVRRSHKLSQPLELLEARTLVDSLGVLCSTTQPRLLTVKEAFAFAKHLYKKIKAPEVESECTAE